MKLTNQEEILIRKIRSHLSENPVLEHVFLVRFAPLDYDGSFVQQVLVGTPQSVLELRVSMKTLLDDLSDSGIQNHFVSILKEPDLIRIYKH